MQEFAKVGDSFIRQVVVACLPHKALSDITARLERLHRIENKQIGDTNFVMLAKSILLGNNDTL